MFQTLILVCSIAFSQSDCQKTTALDIIKGPTAPNEVVCALHGQAYLAQTSLTPRSSKEYVKIICTRT